MTTGDLLERLKTVTGKPAATLVAEPADARHFIAEITFGAVALFLAGKYLDGFVKGLGIEDIGKQHGQALAKTVASLLSIVERSVAAAGATGDAMWNSDLQEQGVAIQAVARDLAGHEANQFARNEAAQTVQELLEARGLPPGEAQRIAASIGAEVLVSSDG